MRQRGRRFHGAAALIATTLVASGLALEDPRRLDPAAWGDDHVGQPLPAYVTGDECLFCHRQIGPTWTDNRHQLSIRPAGPDEPALRQLRDLPGGGPMAEQTQYLLGSRRATRLLKRSRQYGKLDILSACFVPEPSTASGGSFPTGSQPGWDATQFADRCAGCHTTAVETQSQAFSALSLDCYACHGDVPLSHTDDIHQVLLSSQRREPRQVISICGQCHLRGGQSQSTGLPYPNTFVAGDNLFRDFQVDFSDRAIAALHPLDQHVFQSAREVVVFGRSEMSCLSCHDIHGQSSDKHQQLEAATICATCHVAGTDQGQLKDAIRSAQRRRASNRVCDY